MKPYSEDLRERIVNAVEAGTFKSGAARLFGVSLSSVERYARIAGRRDPLRPRKGGGRPPKTDEAAKRLLEEDVKERPAATVSDRRRFLESVTGKALSDSTVGRLLKRMGFSQKNRTVGAMERDEWLRAAWRVTLAAKLDPKRLVFVDEMGTNTSLTVGAARLVAARTKGFLFGFSQPGSEHHDVASEHDGGGYGAVPGGGVRHRSRGVRGLCREDARPEFATRAGRRDGQPFSSQGREGARTGRGARSRALALVPAALLCGP
jgi:transposase